MPSSRLSTLISHYSFTRFILFYLVDVCLHKREGGQDERMYGEKDVICTDKVLLAVVSTLVLFLNLGTEKECQVESLDSSKSYETKVSVVNQVLAVFGACQRAKGCWKTWCAYCIT